MSSETLLYTSVLRYKTRAPAEHVSSRRPDTNQQNNGLQKRFFCFLLYVQKPTFRTGRSCRNRRTSARLPPMHICPSGLFQSEATFVGIVEKKKGWARLENNSYISCHTIQNYVYDGTHGCQYRAKGKDSTRVFPTAAAPLVYTRCI